MFMEWAGWSSVQFSSVPQSCPTLQPHESQHSRPPCPSPATGVYSNSRPSSRWCHPAISSSVVPFSSCPQSLPASESSNESTLRMKWPKYWGKMIRAERGEVICTGALGCSPLHILNRSARKDLRVEFSSPLPSKGHSWDTTQVSFRISGPSWS